MNQGPNEKIKIVLNKLLEEHKLGPKDSLFLTLDVEDFLEDTKININQFIKIMGGLNEKWIVESFKTHKNFRVPYDHSKNKDFTCVLKFSDTFKERAEDYLEYLSNNQSKTRSTSGIILYLEKNGDFWHGNKEEFCYTMGKETIPYRILRFLVENKGLQNTGVIASMLGDKKKRTVMNDIGEMKAKIKYKLQLDDVILNEKPFGYCIDPKYKIVIKD